MIILGMTGGIGVGKSTITAVFRATNIPVLDMDAVVHASYASGAHGAKVIKRLFPSAMNDDGSVNRTKLSEIVMNDPKNLDAIEEGMSPMMALKMGEFVGTQSRLRAPLVVIDAPTLLEMGYNHFMSRVLVVTCDPEEQRRRVMARPGMTEEKFAFINSRQMPEVEKLKHANHVIDTTGSIQETVEKAERLLVELALLDGVVEG
jgi:dephospho-CoA kinase